MIYSEEKKREIFYSRRLKLSKKTKILKEKNPKKEKKVGKKSIKTPIIFALLVGFAVCATDGLRTLENVKVGGIRIVIDNKEFILRNHTNFLLLEIISDYI